MGNAATVCYEAPIAIRAVGDTAIPEMGTPEWREHVQRPEYRERLHDQALEDNAAWEAEQGQSRPLDMRVRELGATGLCKTRFHRDFRERFAVDHPDRMDYEESIHGKTEAELQAEDIRFYEAANSIVLRMTRIDR